MLIYVPMNCIDDNPYQKRSEYGDIEDLANRIVAANSSYPDTLGLMQIPRGRLIVTDANTVVPGENIAMFVRQDMLQQELEGGLFRVQIAFGHRRLRAFRYLQTATSITINGESVPVPDVYKNGCFPIHVEPLTDDQLLDAVWSENHDRKDVSAVEEAELLQAKLTRLQANGGGNQRTVAEAWGLARSTVANRLRLLELPDAVQQANRDGKLSERQCLALLPLYRLPEPARRAADSLPKSSWVTSPANLLESAVDGMTSDKLREAVEDTVNRVTADLLGASFPLDHDFLEGKEGPFGGLQHGTCDGCPLHMKDRCGDESCFDAKTKVWQTERLALASSLTGLEPLPEGVRHYYCEAFTYSDQRAGYEIAAIGCKRNQLFLFHRPDTGVGVRVEGCEDVQIMCHKNGRPCYCLSDYNKKNPTSSPAQRAKERENRIKRRHKELVIKPARAALAVRLSEHDEAAWRLVISRISYGLQQQQVLEMDWDKLLDKLAYESVKGGAGHYHGEWEDVSRSRQRMNEFLEGVGIVPDYPDIPESPPDDKYERIIWKITRVKTWLNSQEEPSREAVQGNITNLEKYRQQIIDIPPQQMTSELNEAFTETAVLLKQMDALLTPKEVEPANLVYSWLSQYADYKGRTWRDLTDTQVHHANSPCYKACVAAFPDLDDLKLYLKQALARLRSGNDGS